MNFTKINTNQFLVAALFVQPDGCYSKLPTVDAWPESRDARHYDGNLPVVAHPPCSRWSRLARFCEVRHGLKVGADGGCFEAALKAVRANGGVIEHPAFSKAWERFGLPRPETKHQGWTIGMCGGYSCYVEQGRYGHTVKKATWLYVFGVPVECLPELRWGHTPDSRGTVSKNQDWRGGMDKWRDATGHRAANATPPEFRDVLLRLAISANKTILATAPSQGNTNQNVIQTMKKQAKKTTVKKAKKPTCKALNLSDFLVQPFEVNAKKVNAYQEKLKDVHTLQAFLSTANTQDVREALLVESMGRGRPDTLLRILGRLGVMTKDHFCKKLGITRPKLVKVKKAIQDTDLI